MGGWSNEIHHTIGPVFMALDIVFGPGRTRQSYRSAILVLIVPVVWLAFTLLRAPFVASLETGSPPWYPYPFLDPGLMPGRFLGVAGAVALVLLVFVVIALAQIRLSAAGKGAERG